MPMAWCQEAENRESDADSREQQTVLEPFILSELYKVFIADLIYICLLCNSLRLS